MFSQNGLGTIGFSGKDRIGDGAVFGVDIALLRTRGEQRGNTVAFSRRIEVFEKVQKPVRPAGRQKGAVKGVVAVFQLIDIAALAFGLLAQRIKRGHNRGFPSIVAFAIAA